MKLSLSLTRYLMGSENSDITGGLSIQVPVILCQKLFIPLEAPGNLGIHILSGCSIGFEKDIRSCNQLPNLDIEYSRHPNESSHAPSYSSLLQP